VASNAAVLYLIVTTPGYKHLSMVNVFALYSSRPRVNQIWTGLLRAYIGPVAVGEKVDVGGEAGEYVYTDSYVSTLVGELFLQILSAVFIGVT